MQAQKLTKKQMKDRLSALVKELNSITQLEYSVYKIGRSWWLKCLSKDGLSSHDLRYKSFEEIERSLSNTIYSALLIHDSTRGATC